MLKSFLALSYRRLLIQLSFELPWKKFHKQMLIITLNRMFRKNKKTQENFFSRQHDIDSYLLFSLLRTTINPGTNIRDNQRRTAQGKNRKVDCTGMQNWMNDIGARNILTPHPTAEDNLDSVSSKSPIQKRKLSG